MFKYITDEEFSKWPITIYESPFLQNINFDGPVIESKEEKESSDLSNFLKLAFSNTFMSLIRNLYFREFHLIH